MIFVFDIGEMTVRHTSTGPRVNSVLMEAKNNLPITVTFLRHGADYTPAASSQCLIGVKNGTDDFNGQTQLAGTTMSTLASNSISGTLNLVTTAMNTFMGTKNITRNLWLGLRLEEPSNSASISILLRLQNPVLTGDETPVDPDSGYPVIYDPTNDVNYTLTAPGGILQLNQIS